MLSQVKHKVPKCRENKTEEPIGDCNTRKQISCFNIDNIQLGQLAKPASTQSAFSNLAYDDMDEYESS